ncbi:MAG: FimV/HubP family polar landmark protein, partial [Pseudomonas sp.]
APAAQTAMSVSSAPTDALEGAKIYIAYGRFSEALGVLRLAVDQAPQRLDLRLRLLEVLGALGDGVGFAREEAILRELGASAEQLVQIKARYPALATATAPDPLGHAVLALDQPSSSQAGDAADDSQLNLDDLSLDADWASLNPFETAAPARSKAAAAQPPAAEPGFDANLEELPQVFELTVDQDFLSPFDESPAVAGPEEETLAEEFLDVFGDQPQGSNAQPLEADLDQLASSHDHLTKLNLALAYIEQGDLESACRILNEVIGEGDDEEKREARALLALIA